jgi:hypothetical protein
LKLSIGQRIEPLKCDGILPREICLAMSRSISLASRFWSAAALRMMAAALALLRFRAA